MQSLIKKNTTDKTRQNKETRPKRQANGGWTKPADKSKRLDGKQAQD